MLSLKDVMGTDLAGYQLVYGHFLELKHGLMGFFPARVKGTKEVVLCVDETVLAEVEALLSKRERKRGRILLLANLVQAKGFNLTNDPNENISPMYILTQDEFVRLVKEKGSDAFEWAPGLVGNDMSLDEFRDSILVAKDTTP
jgi:hypothetical protein